MQLIRSTRAVWCTLASLALAPAALADIPEDWPLYMPECGTATSSEISLEAGDPTPCWYGTTFALTALKAGTMTLDLSYGTPGTSGFIFASVSLRVKPPEGGPPTTIYASGMCPGSCSQLVPGLTFDVAPGSVVEGQIYSPFGAEDLLWLKVSDIRFKPHSSFVDLGDDLDGSLIRKDKSGQPLVLIDDVDGDGLGDIAFNDSAKQFGATPRLRVVSGLSGALISDTAGKTGAGSGAWLDDVGDLDGDGLVDLAVGDQLAVSGGNQGVVRVRSAATGALLLEVFGSTPASEFGASVAGVGDVDLDGVPDVLVGAPRDDVFGTDEGSARLISGASGSELLTLAPKAPAQSFDFGRYVVPAGDLNADGRPDLLVRHGDPSLDVVLFDGATGAFLFALQSESPTYPRCVVAGPDLDLDGHADIVVGLPAEAGGDIEAHSGADGHLLWEVQNSKSWQLGAAIAALDDQDGDGVVDVLVGLPEKDIGLGRVELRSGADGSVIFDSPAPADLFGNPNFPYFGRDLDAGHDVNGDGTPDAVVLAPPKNRLFVLSGAAADHVAPVLAGEGYLMPGKASVLSLEQGLPDGPAVLVVGLVEFFLPLKGGYLQAKPDVLLPLLLDGRGAASLQVHLPPGTPADVSFWLQSWHPDASGTHGWKSSNVLEAFTL